MPGIQLLNDSIVSVGKPFDAFDAHERNVRDAMFILTCALPILGAGLVLLARDGWWRRHARLSIQTVIAAWLASITAFGIAIYLQHGVTTRGTFVLAVMHEQIEVLLDLVLFGLGARRAFAVTWLFGAMMILAVLVLPSMSTVFMISSIIGGGNDALIALLFLYGRQWLFAFGALGHLASAIMVFTEVIRNIGVVPYNAVIFLSLCVHVGATVIGIMQLEEPQREDGAVHLDDYEGGSPVSAPSGAPSDGPMRNPLASTTFSKRTLLKLVGLGLLGSTGVTLYLAFVLPSGVGQLWHAAVFVAAGVALIGVLTMFKGVL